MSVPQGAGSPGAVERHLQRMDSQREQALAHLAAAALGG